jgi:hypothetical protein
MLNGVLQMAPAGFQLGRKLEWEEMDWIGIELGLGNGSDPDVFIDIFPLARAICTRSMRQTMADGGRMKVLFHLLSVAIPSSRTLREQLKFRTPLRKKLLWRRSACTYDYISQGQSSYKQMQRKCFISVPSRKPRAWQDPLGLARRAVLRDEF